MKEKANSVEALQAAVDLLETIPNDPDAERLIVVCKRQMRERMLAYSEVLIGCHAAEHLILSGESEEKRIIVAKYYYDSDTEEEEQAAAAAERHTVPLKIVDLRTILLLIAVVGLAAALVIVLFFQKEAPQVQPERHTYPAIPSISTLLETDSSHSATTETKQSVKADAKIESNPIVSQIEPTQALFTADADAIACGEYRYVLSEGNPIELKQLVLTADKKKYWNKFKKSCQTKTNDCYIYKPERSDFYRQMVILAMRFPMTTSKNCFYCQPMTRKPVCSYYQKMECFLLSNI